MSLSLEYIDACLPITATKAFVLGDARLILHGQGPYTRLIDETSGQLLAEIKTFKRSNVHGFLLPEEELQKTGSQPIRIITWGGPSVRIIELSARQSESTVLGAFFSVVSAEFLAPDWILSGCSVCVDGEGRACFLTAHNALLGLRLVDSGSPKYRKNIQIQQLATGVKSILYSADIVSLSSTHVLIAAGTVFGEIIVWSCFLNEIGDAFSNTISSIHHFFTGHEGSIFGVRISSVVPSLQGSNSGRLLASCSDDRTVRVWDISDCDQVSRHDPPSYSTDGFELRSTGFGDVATIRSSESYVAKAFGHSARIWGVYFLPRTKADQPQLNFVSHGEDSTCVFWELTWEPRLTGGRPDFRLRETNSIHHHSGKHIWSLDVGGRNEAPVIYTGGADGALKNIGIESYWKERPDYMSNRKVAPSSVKTRKHSHQLQGALKAFDLVSQDCFLGVTFQGEVKLGWVGTNNDNVCQDEDGSVRWETIATEEDFRSFAVTSSCSQRGLALLGNERGLIRLYEHESKTLSTLIQVSERPVGLWLLDSSESNRGDIYFISSDPATQKTSLVMINGRNTGQPTIKNFDVALPIDFEVTCASFACESQYLVLGSKIGALAVYKVSALTQILEPLEVLRRVHGKVGVSQVMPIPSKERSLTTFSSFFLTCGRDGNYCIYEISRETDEQTAFVQLVHRSLAHFGQNVEGAYFDRETEDLILYGFGGTQFIVWNESRQTELMRVECGGGRRRWAFGVNEACRNYLLLWNHAAKFNSTRQSYTPAYRTLRAGGHGREIKSMAVCNDVRDIGTLIATGAEDTAVRIFSPAESSKREGPWGTFKCLRVMNQHGTGLQQVKWSKAGDYLFSSSGLEEFFVWRVTSVPVFGVASVLIASAPKEDLKSDLRVTSFDMLQLEGSDQFIFCLTYSNSTLKIFHFAPCRDRGDFILLARGRYMTNCLTQAQFVVKESSISLITAATDGYITVWNLTPVLQPFYTVSSGSVGLKRPLVTDEITPQAMTCENRYQIHSNSIKALELVHLSESQSLVVTGGDDNSVSVSLWDIFELSVATVTIADAHAASVTAIKVLNHTQEADGMTHRLVIASSGNDHRVKVWSVSVGPLQNGPQRIGIKSLLDEYSSVADISSLDVLRDNQLLVCGVGMELFRYC
ncbi:hypothetical protein ASPZODRAFT_131831 [Penicilliopsis zonata CBS 506.65]|uniref:Uncharacterized protein n=1 Tax=Penicilliopsis zonata CBS 506.65 TaxID=1073090 RepID=A0A1L9SIJ1_9EURO|nr:hypothetical protein ASPZODRAFT_131831 [Penicilliopsis zonata CBS 506.65]OJJ46921.1 hypothetical protein ASPZODRAFT_131831 [Penicilliopsis zonata CBS 506.65]